MAWPNRKAVLVPIDFSEVSFDALDEALAMVASPADVHAIHVLPALDSEADFLRGAFDPTCRDGRAEAALQARMDGGREGVQVHVRTGVAGDVIAEAATEFGCDLIVIPSRGRSGLSRLLLGSVAERVLRMATCPVLVLRAN